LKSHSSNQIIVIEPGECQALFFIHNLNENYARAKRNSTNITHSKNPSKSKKEYTKSRWD
jgi:hypothetical protein